MSEKKLRDHNETLYERKRFIKLGDYGEIKLDFHGDTMMKQNQIG